MESDTFLTLAELSLALIGFAALVAAFRRGREGFTLVQRGSVRFLVEVALTAFALSLLPVLVGSFGVSGTPLWRVCSLFGGALIGWHIAYSLSRTLRARMLSESLQTGHGYVAGFPALLAVVANLVNATGWFWPTAVGPYVALVIAQLGAACVFFVFVFFSFSDDAEPAA